MSKLLFACVLAGAALAAPPPGIVAYPSEYFVESSPSTAADMVARLPGFTPIGADDDARGYAAAQGNILIDGARPASKRESIDDVLARIPAHAVERVEVILAGTPGFEFFGHAKLANVVRRAASKRAGSVETRVLADDGGGIAAGFDAEATREWEDRHLEITAASKPELDDDSGRGERRRYAPDGRLENRSRYEGRDLVRESLLGTAYSHSATSGKVHLFASLRETDARERMQMDTQSNDEQETLRELEASARWARTAANGDSLEFLASQRSGRGSVREQERTDAEEELFHQSTHSGESILRFDWHRSRIPRLSWNAGFELALNTLSGQASLVDDGQPILLPGSRVEIDELRGEGSVGVQWQMSDAWRLDSGLSLEQSRLRQQGDAPSRRDLAYFKPRLATRWQRSEKETWRFSFSRHVAQLSFDDFVATAALDRDELTAGNSRLVPDNAWRLELAREGRFGRDGALSLTLAHERIEDVLDRVPVTTDDETYDAPGNIGGGRRDSLELGFGSSLDALHLPEWRLDAALLWQRTRVADPVTRERRQISGESPLEGEVSLTQVIADRGIRWGIELELQEREREFRFDQTVVEHTGAGWALFLEHRTSTRWRWRLQLTATRDDQEDRFGQDGIELRQHDVPAQLLFSLRRDAGG